MTNDNFFSKVSVSLPSLSLSFTNTHTHKHTTHPLTHTHTFITTNISSTVFTQSARSIPVIFQSELAPGCCLTSAKGSLGQQPLVQSDVPHTTDGSSGIVSSTHRLQSQSTALAEVQRTTVPPGRSWHC